MLRKIQMHRTIHRKLESLHDIHVIGYFFQVYILKFSWEKLIPVPIIKLHDRHI